MKYYVVSDVHGFYQQMIDALNEKGFFDDDQPHKLVICGDLFDRGSQALELSEFVVDMLKKEQIILIRGNHEDLLETLVDELEAWMIYGIENTHHYRNGTYNTLLQLSGMTSVDAYIYTRQLQNKIKLSDAFKIILPSMVNYFETEHYVFVHGWIPSKQNKSGDMIYYPNWRNADSEAWVNARWTNGMAAAHSGVIEPKKTIICGHFHASYGHSVFEQKGSQFGRDSDFSPYYSDGIIAIDGCTAFSGKVNCIVLEDN